MNKLPPGTVRDAIMQTLAERGGEGTVSEIQAVLSARFNGALPASSVRSYLRLNTPGQFRRVSRGRYRLTRQVPTFSTRVKPAPVPFFAFNSTTLYRDDCLEWLAARERQSVHAIVTDPPYGLIEYSPEQQVKLRARQGGVWRIPPSFDGHQRSPLPRFTVLGEDDLRKLRLFFGEWARRCFPVLVPGAHIAVASNPLLSHHVSAALMDAGFEVRATLVRLVMTMRGGDRPKNAHEEFSDISVMPRSMWEPWLLFRKPLCGRVQDNLRLWKTGGLRRPSQDKPFGDVIKSHPTRADERRLAPHPSLKPQAFLRQLVRAILPLGQGVILDPFAGSGSTLAAAAHLGHVAIGIEKDEHYCRMATDAIPRLTALTCS